MQGIYLISIEALLYVLFKTILWIITTYILFSDSQIKDDLMMARIRDAEHTQCVAELTQKISLLELKVNYYLSNTIMFQIWNGIFRNKILIN